MVPNLHRHRCAVMSDFDPRTAHARAVSGIDPSGATGRHARIASRSATRRPSGNDIAYAIAEAGMHVDGTCRDSGEARLREQRLERRGGAAREPDGFVEDGVVPHVQCDRAPRPTRSHHLGHHLRRLRYIIEHKPRDDRVEGIASDRKRLPVAHLESGPCAGHAGVLVVVSRIHAGLAQQARQCECTPGWVRSG